MEIFWSEMSASNYSPVKTLPWLRGRVFQVWWLRLSKPGFVFSQTMNSSFALPVWLPVVLLCQVGSGLMALLIVACLESGG